MHLKKLKIILQYNHLYYLLLILSILISAYILNLEPSSIYNNNSKYVCGYVTDLKKEEDKTTIYLKSKENILIKYNKKIDNISYGDYLKIKGKFYKPNNNTNFNLFNYKKYLLSKKIIYIVNANNIKIIKKNNNIFFKLKNILLNKIEKCNKSKGYLRTFIFADKNYISDDLILNYQNLGIIHLFAVSGMHVSLVVLLLSKILKFIESKKRYLIISLVLLLYMFLTNFTISMVRSSIQFILFSINKLFNLKIKNINIVILLFSILLLYNPYYIYNIGFLFTFVISFSLILFNKVINRGNVIIKSFKLSIISFLSSLPILINNFNQVNFFSIFYNLFYVPFVSFILFPFSLLTLLFSFLDNINYVFITVFENISGILSKNNLLTFNIAKVPIVLIVIYYIILYRLFSKYNKKKLINLIMIIIIFILYKKYLLVPQITFIDIGQGDSSLIRLKNKNILIDTGGNVRYSISKNILMPYIKSEGINKIDYLIISHGDYDHMGEAITLVNNFKVDKVIFNCGELNNLEKELIKVLDKKKIKYYSCIKELNIDKNKLYFLQTKEYDNENDNSNVIYTELNGYKFMFMGDAGIDKEKDILEKYNISNIDVLKVGHHGSKTSSSEEFINEMNQKYSVISVGKKNRYGHPNKEVLENLENSKIYRTDQDGSIMFKIKNNKLKIETCSP